jgi:hypothetical protein
MAKRTRRKSMRRRSTKRRPTKRRVLRKRSKKTRRMMAQMKVVKPWTCAGCGVTTNQDPCRLVTHREKYLVEAGTNKDGTPHYVQKERDKFCNTKKT